MLIEPHISNSKLSLMLCAARLAKPSQSYSSVIHPRLQLPWRALLAPHAATVHHEATLNFGQPPLRDTVLELCTRTRAHASVRGKESLVVVRRQVAVDESGARVVGAVGR